jgi:hypothetical protein
MEACLKKEINGFMYEVGYDVFFDVNNIDIDFDSDEDKEAYRQRFIKDELISCWVVKNEKCRCCNEWRHVDSMGDIHAEDFEQALEYYLNG